MSIHGFYTVVEKITAPNKAVLRPMHRSHAGFNPYVPGDLLSVSDGRTMNETGMVTIKDARFMDDMYRLFAEFTEDIRTRLHPGDYLGNPSRTPEVSVTDCNFSDFPAIRFGTARSVYFARNHVKSFHSLLLNDLVKYRYASGHVNRVNIEENVFENSGNAIRTLLERPAGCNVLHRFVRIMKNRFVNWPCLLNAADVNYLTFQDNVYDEGCVKLARVMNADIQEIAGAENASHGLLLMHWKMREISVGNCPIGYTLHRWHRGGDKVLSKDEFEKEWLRCVFRANPCGSSDFFWLYEDKRIPNDGFFAVLDEHGNMAAAASAQMDEYCPNSATLHMVYTDLNHRGKGLEEIVSRTAMRYVYDAGVPEAYIAADDIHSGIHIFLKNGFKPVLYTAEMTERWRRVLTGPGIAEVTAIAIDIHG